MIKLLLTSSLLALTAAEADPQLLYGAGLPYAAGVPYVGASVGAVAHVPVVKSDVVTPAEVSHEVAASPVVVGYHGHPAFGYYGKRSADAAVLGGASRVLTAPTPLIHNPPVLPAVTYAHPLGYAVPYAGLHYAGLRVVAPAAPAAAEAVVAERKKREADPQVLLSGLPYAAPILAPVGAIAHVPVVKNVEVTPAEVSHEVTAHTVPVAVGYHGLGFYGKRSADADPAILAGSTRVISAPTPLIHNPPVRPVLAAPALAYAGLPYAGYAGLAGVLPATHVIAKRDAEADPAVLAGPAYAAYGYGLGLPYHGLAATHVIAKREAEADPQLIAGLPYAGLPVAGFPLAAAHAVPHVPVVKSVVDSPAEVATEVTG